MNKQKLDPIKVHATSSKLGILLVNLGTPDAPTAQKVRPYLKQFLSDPRVIEIPKIIWWFILNLIILPIRSSASAKKYASVWMDGPEGGAPLFVYSNQQAVLLRQELNTDPSHPVVVELGMRYGNPSLASALDTFDQQGVDRLLVLPLYPQYSAATTASTYDEIFRVYKESRNPPEIRTIKHFHDHPLYIAALKAQVEEFWEQHGKPNFERGEKLIMSFHGVPKRTLDFGDPYHCECHKTGRLLREALGLTSDEALVSFQSRFGKAEWLKPYTAPLLESLGKLGTTRVDIFCPGFPADCLETLEEIAMEGKEIFRHAGGQSYNAIPCLNSQTQWIMALRAMVEEHTRGWGKSSTVEELELRKTRYQVIEKSLTE